MEIEPSPARDLAMIWTRYKVDGWRDSRRRIWSSFDPTRATPADQPRAKNDSTWKCLRFERVRKADLFVADEIFHQRQTTHLQRGLNVQLDVIRARFDLDHADLPRRFGPAKVKRVASNARIDRSTFEVQSEVWFHRVVLKDGARRSARRDRERPYRQLSLVDSGSDLSRENVDHLRVAVLDEHLPSVGLLNSSNQFHPLNGRRRITVELAPHDRWERSLSIERGQGDSLTSVVRHAEDHGNGRTEKDRPICEEKGWCSRCRNDVYSHIRCEDCRWSRWCRRDSSPDRCNYRDALVGRDRSAAPPDDSRPTEKRQRWFHWPARGTVRSRPGRSLSSYLHGSAIGQNPFEIETLGGASQHATGEHCALRRSVVIETQLNRGDRGQTRRHYNNHILSLSGRGRRSLPMTLRRYSARWPRRS